MKRKLLSMALLAISAFGLNAQNLVSPIPADLGDYEALSGDYTIEVEGTADTEIKIPYDAYTYITYTPTAAGTVRFVVDNGIVSVYEKDGISFAIKGKSAISSPTYPEVTDENVGSINLLENGDFAIKGDLIPNYSDRWTIGTPWITGNVSGDMIRVGNHAAAHDGIVYVWRADPNPADGWFSQEVANIKPNAYYQVRVKVVDNTNGTGPISVCLGSAAGGYDYGYKSFTTGVGTFVQELATPSLLSDNSYFSVVNRGIVNSTGNTANHLNQIDWISMVEATPIDKGIIGASSAQYVEEAVYPSIDVDEDMDVTNLITDAAVTSKQAWGGDAAGRTNVNEQYTGAPDNTYLDAWNATYDMTQNVVLPAGRYELKCATRAEPTLKVGYIYVSKDGEQLNSTDVHKDNNSGGELGNGWGWTTVLFELTEPATVTIGFKSECGGGLWAGADDFHLTYLTPSSWLNKNKEAYATVVESAKAVDRNQLMNKEVKSAFQSALNEYGEVNSEEVNDYIGAIRTLKTVTTDANNSIAAYADGGIDIAAYKAKMATVLDNTNVYTTEAYNKWYVNVEENYSNGEYTDGEVVTLNANGAYNTGWRSPNRIDDVLLSAWTCNGEQVEDGDYTNSLLHVNTWSTEGDGDGSNFQVPFFECLTGDATSLEANTFTATQKVSLANGAYKVTAWVRVRAADDKTKVANSIQFSVGEGTPIDVVSSTQVGNSQFYIGEYTAYGFANDEGILTIKFDVAAESNVSWLAFKNVKWEAVEETVTIGKIGYATFSSESALDLSGIDGGTAYIVTDDAVDGDYIKLTEQTEAVPANTGLIIAGEEGTVTIPVVATANPLDNKNYLVAGTGAAAPQGSYVLSCKYAEGGKDLDLSTVGFYAVEDDQPIVEKGKAYLDFGGNNTIGAKALYFVFGDGTATAIETAETAEADADGAIYNVAGQQVGKDYKGIVIKNGKKYLNK